ncbi:metallophosphoesterase [Longimicrobium sp.]|uniref:metallophosphoesterase n=1 Tax=Longimicrobium sp. TaxID=2029185 RepID=UPI002E361625|nr:metallophosphoesterase [Longimicrobium sp.]HEX6039783.1 metallophosphoesterase [Longimicrobium sp.]
MRTCLRFAFVLSACALAAACGRDGARPTAAAEADSTARGDSLRAIYGATGGDIVRVVPVEIEVVGLPAGWEGMRVAALSDFHLGMWPGNTETALAAVQRAIAEKPDAFVLLGDYVARGQDYTALDRVLAPLRGKPVFAVLGNEDMVEDPDEPDSTLIRTRQAMQRAGITLLENRRAPFVRNNDTAYIGGIDPYTARRPEWRRAEIYGGIGGGARTPLLLAHMPVAAVTLPTDKYPAVVAGHTFCGQVEVPGTPRLSWFNTEVLPGTADPARTRIYRVRGSTLFITCGLGFGYVPVRFGAPPEIAMITLRGVGAVAPSDSARAPGAVNVDSLIQSFTPTDSTNGEDTDSTAAEEG